MKKIFALFMAVLMTLTAFCAIAEEKNMLSREEIPLYSGGGLDRLGVLKGTEKGFELERAVTRAEALAFISRTLAMNEENAKQSPFTDVKGHWAEKTVDLFYEKFKSYGLDYVIAIESRGYLFGAPLAYKLGCGLVVVRKPGKLPAEVERVEYDLEYGTDILEIHKDAIEQGKKVLVIDDLLATGGTVGAVCKLLERIGAKVVVSAFVVELSDLNGKNKLPSDIEVFSLHKV